VTKQARDLKVGKRLWDVSETLAGVSFDLARQSSNAELAHERLVGLQQTTV